MKNIIVLLFFFTCLQLDAQVHSFVSAGYFGDNITHYGFTASYDYSFLDVEKKHSQKWQEAKHKHGSKVSHQLFISAKLDAYRHPKNLYGISIAPQLTYQFNYNSCYFSIGIATAYFHYFLDGKTYEMQEDGSLKQIKFAGGSAFSPYTNVGLGKKFYKGAIPFSIWLKGQINFQIPKQLDYTFYTALIAGVTFPMMPKKAK